MNRITESRLHPLSARLLRLSRPAKRLLQACADFLLIVASVYLAYVLRLDTWTPRDPAHVAIAALIAAATAVATFERLGLYKALVRYMGEGQIPALAGGLAASIVVMAVSSWMLELFVPRSVPALFALVAIVILGGVRLLARNLLLYSDSARRTPVAIYGAGSAGRQLAGALLSGREYAPVLFVDDNVSLHTSSVMGLPVFDPGALPQLVPEYAIGRVLFAMPSVSATRRREILNRIVSLPVPVLSVPGVNEIVSGRISIGELRAIASGDLLGRAPVPPSPEWMAADIRGKVVMVTGAGGSIGSELCRLVVAQNASALVLFEASEFALYSVESELQTLALQGGNPVALHAVLGSVRDDGRLREAIRQYAVDTIYHAAAYKHVPLVERNPSEGLLNNTFGTATAARIAVECGVRTFVLVSTDKAVRPTSVMGASKRLAELICQDWGHRQKGTRFSIVRFGNVLDSSGSVVPLFRKQIERGGPVTVTHPEITRYFMTIREAAELVIQAGAMAAGGEVFVLDMGTPIRIADLARSMIILSEASVKDAANPNGDIEIRYTGLRPGEKLHEELLIGTNVLPTGHPRIHACREAFVTQPELEEILERTRRACATEEFDGIADILMQLPLHYAKTGNLA